MYTSKFNSLNSGKLAKQRKGRLYTCGFRTGRLAQLLFDDFLTGNIDLSTEDHDIPRFSKEANNATSDDVLYFGGNYLDWCVQYFPGKILVQNGESVGDPTGPNIVMISSQPTSERNIYVPFISVVFVGQIPPDMWPTLTLEGFARPQNSGKHFLVYATSHCVSFREEVALALSQLGVIHHGQCRPKSDHGYENFTQLPDAGEYDWSTNYRLYRNYRFCLVLENERRLGYITEKILMAFLGGCVPIWYGTTEIWDMFHPDTFLYVNLSDPASVKTLVQRVEELERNASAYQAMFQHALLANGKVTLEKYFSLDESIGNGRLKHEIRVMMGLED